MLWSNQTYYHDSTLKCSKTFYFSVTYWKEDTMWIFRKNSKSQTAVEGDVLCLQTLDEIQRQNFWYRTGFRINVVQRSLDFFNPESLKKKLLEYMWMYFNRHYTENNPCTWIFICLCVDCRANPRL